MIFRVIFAPKKLVFKHKMLDTQKQILVIKRQNKVRCFAVKTKYRALSFGGGEGN